MTDYPLDEEKTEIETKEVLMNPVFIFFHPSAIQTEEAILRAAYKMYAGLQRSGYQYKMEESFSSSAGNLQLDASSAHVQMPLVNVMDTTCYLNV